MREHNKKEITRMLEASVDYLYQLSVLTGVGYEDLGTDKEPNLWARNAGKAVISHRNHLLNRLEDLNEV